MTVIVQDSFNRSDNTTLGVSETGQTWQYYSGTFGISGNQALAKTAAIHNNCFVDVGVQGDYRVSAKFNSIFDSSLIGLIFKRNSTASDNSFYALRKNSSNLQIVRNNNGFSTLSSVATTFADGDVLSVECVGSEIKFYQNGVLKGAVTDNTLTTNTGYGIYSSNNTVALFDDFIVEDFNTGGGDTGTDGEITLGLTQQIYSDSSVNLSLTQSIYADISANLNLVQSIYKDTEATLNLTQAIYQDVELGLNLRQEIYAEAESILGLIQEIISDGSGFIALGLNQEIYHDSSSTMNLRQEIYEQKEIILVLNQEFYEIQTIVSVIALHGNSQAAIQLKGKTPLTIHLHGTNPSMVHLKGGIQ